MLNEPTDQIVQHPDADFLRGLPFLGDYTEETMMVKVKTCALELVIFIVKVLYTL